MEGFEEKKIEALKIYDEEMKAYPHPRSYEAVINKMKSSGNEVGLNFAERFQTMRRINI